MANFEKLKFTGYKDINFKSGDELGSYSVMINPASVKRNFSIKYDEKQSKGATSSDKKHNFTKPESWSFDFTIDGTGISSTTDNGAASLGDNHDIVANEITQLLKIIYDYVSGEHRHPYVTVEYSGLILKCVLTSLSINYSLFHPDGMPLRAQISCTFESAINQLAEAKKNDIQSPDITHYRVLKENETLISKAYETYNNIDYYSEVARKNDLNNFRKIEQGTPILFPPIKK